MYEIIDQQTGEVIHITDNIQVAEMYLALFPGKYAFYEVA